MEVLRSVISTRPSCESTRSATNFAIQRSTWKRWIRMRRRRVKICADSARCRPKFNTLDCTLHGFEYCLSPATYGRIGIPSPLLFTCPSKRSRGIKLARWVFGCPDCDYEFTHSEIDSEIRPPLLDPFAWIDDKPELPEAGVRLECPSCKKVSVFRRYQLTYRA